MALDLAIRSTGIGASEAPAALGVSPFQSAFALWCVKVGELDPADLSDVEAVKWGRRLEPIVGEAFAEETGREVEHNVEQETLRSDSAPFMLATLDFTQRKNGSTLGALEIKTTNAFAAGDWKSGPPIHVQVQLQHQLAVTGFEWGTVAALIGGQRLVYWDMGRDDRFIDAMIERERIFWGMVERGERPPVDGSPQTAEAIRKLYATATGETIDLPAEADEWDRELVSVKAEIKKLEAKKREIETLLKASIGSASLGVLPCGDCYSFANRERNIPPSEGKTITYRELRRKTK